MAGGSARAEPDRARRGVGLELWVSVRPRSGVDLEGADEVELEPTLKLIRLNIKYPWLANDLKVFTSCPSQKSVGG